MGPWQAHSKRGLSVGPRPLHTQFHYDSYFFNILLFWTGVSAHQILAELVTYNIYQSSYFYFPWVQDSTSWEDLD